jgi:arsenate reductase
VSVLRRHQTDTEYRDFFKDRLSAEELEKLIGAHPITEFISTRAKSYKATGWDKKPPTRKQAIAAMLKDPTLLRRPILVKGSKVFIGFSRSDYEKLATGRK